MSHHRVGLVVPSSNVTVETELPRLLGGHPSATFSFHSTRMRMHTVSEEELRAMDGQRERCLDEIADASVDAVLYACLVALMAKGSGQHQRTETAVRAHFGQRGAAPLISSSAGALVAALRALDARRIGLVMPYVQPIARLVVDYLAAEDFDVVAWTALEVADNAEVACIPGERVRSAARGLDLGSSDALVISACVQMPSLNLVADAERELGLPVLSAATAGAFAILDGLALPIDLPGAGQLLARDAVRATI
jgi:maleate isomerase